MVPYGRDRRDVFFLALCHLRVFFLILGIAGNWLGGPLRKVKRIVDDQIKCRPFTDFARITREYVTVRILPNVMNDRASINSAEVVKQARVPAVLRI